MDSKSVFFKLIVSYDVDPDRLQEYYQFVMARYLPLMQQKGLEMLQAWTAMYGDVPNRQIEFVAPDRETVMELLEDDTWTALNEQLNQYVTDFDYKVVPYREGFQI